MDRRIEYVLGLDISTAKTGWTIMEKDSKEIFSCGAISFLGHDSFEEKILMLYENLLPIFDFVTVSKVGIEDQFFFKNVNTLKILARFSGAACLIASQRRIPVEFYPPMTIKKIFTGKGNATKDETREKVFELYKNDIDSDDITDSISVAYVATQDLPPKIKKVKIKKPKTKDKKM